MINLKKHFGIKIDKIGKSKTRDSIYNKHWSKSDEQEEQALNDLEYKTRQRFMDPKD